MSENKDVDDEVLYGLAGYLYALMLVHDPVQFNTESCAK